MDRDDRTYRIDHFTSAMISRHHRSGVRFIVFITLLQVTAKNSCIGSNICGIRLPSRCCRDQLLCSRARTLSTPDCYDGSDLGSDLYNAEESVEFRVKSVE